MLGGIYLYDYKYLLAHYDKENGTNKQLLIDHLFEVSKLAKNTGKLINLSSICELIGILHDFGKYENLYQKYIRGEYKGNVVHSSAGAKILDHIEIFVKREYEIDSILESERIRIRAWKIYKEIMQYSILAHHGLYDIIDNNYEYRTIIRLEYDKYGDYDFSGKGFGFFGYLNDEYSKLSGKSLYDLYYQGFLEFINVYKKLRHLASRQADNSHKNKALNFYYGALVRLLLSILKDADIYNSSNYYREIKDIRYSVNEVSNIWTQMNHAVENLYRKFNNKCYKTELDVIRTQLANKLYSFAQKYNNGAYKLSMPVGAGKTYAALRYAVTNAEKFNKQRIFYCTAFLSVLEQNASSIKSVIGEEYVLEHHSNVIYDSEIENDKADNEEYNEYEYLKESWESPVILTTIVQLSNTLFKDKSTNIRRFSKLINSVIIIDEVQSLPTKVIYNFNLMTNFLTYIMNCNILHCTATQPNFDNMNALTYPCFYNDDLESILVTNSIHYSEVFNRVVYYNLLGNQLDTTLNTEELISHIKEQLKNESSALIVLNTKKAVSNLYNGLIQDSEIKDLNYEVIYLTTNQCPVHRLQIISKMKNRLTALRNDKEQQKLICVSTKLVEAGVDIDFDLVYRSLAGIDSIIQCGGRCNREGRKLTKGKLFVFEYKDENLRQLPDLEKQRIAAKSALRVLKNEGLIDFKIDIEKASSYYFSKLFSNEVTQGRYLEYPIDQQDTILNLLTTNPIGTENYKIKHRTKPYFILKQSFKTAAINFDLIKENTISVITQYDNDNLIDRLYDVIEKNDYENIKRLLKKLQPYTISIRKIADFDSFITKELDGTILILNKEAYDDNVGLVKSELQPLVY